MRAAQLKESETAAPFEEHLLLDNLELFPGLQVLRAGVGAPVEVDPQRPGDVGDESGRLVGGREARHAVRRVR